MTGMVKKIIRSCVKNIRAAGENPVACFFVPQAAVVQDSLLFRCLRRRRVLLYWPYQPGKVCFAVSLEGWDMEVNEKAALTERRLIP